MLARLILRCALCLLIAVAVLPAGEPRAEAEAHAQEGLAALKASDADPAQAVEAALAFSRALTLYKGLGDTDAVNEMQANIFWCKKRMDIDRLQEYLARGDHPRAAEARVAKAVLSAVVPPSQAAEYLERAVQYRDAHPDRHLQAAIRFSEVLERFPGTPEATTAQQRFAAANIAYLRQVTEDREREKQVLADKRKELEEAIDTARRSRFQRPPPVGDGRTELPAKPAQDAALALLKQTYPKEFARRKDLQKRSFARRLLGESEANREDRALSHAMLTESLRLATESEDYATLLDAVERLGAGFEGYDADAAKRQALGRIRSKPVAAAILTLLDKPEDPAANTVAGRFFCLQLDRWEDGLAMLVQGSDRELAEIAAMELAQPAVSQEQEQTAARWMALGRRSGGDRIPMWERAQHWYSLAAASATGIRKTQIEKALAEIDKALPAVITDWDRVTLSQWTKLRGQLVSVPMKVDRSSSGVTLRPGTRLRVVPHPDYVKSFKVRVGTSGPFQLPGIVEGDGVLWIEPTWWNQWNSETWNRGKEGEMIHMKLVPVTDED